MARRSVRAALLVVSFAVWCAGAGTVAMLLARRGVDAPAATWPYEFRLVRDEGDPLRVTPERPLDLPYSYGDYDLWATVEIPEGGELDLVFRRLEARDAHGRFALLRMSSLRAGPPYRTREQALFEDGVRDADLRDPERRGGVRLAPGRPASVHLEARGRRVRANVAGMPQPWFETSDDRGGHAFVVRGGVALVHRLYVRPAAEPGGLERLTVPPFATWAAAGGLALLAAIAAALLGAPPLRVAFAFAIALPLGGFAGGELLLRHLVPQVEPSFLGGVLAASAGLPLALLAARWPRAAVRGRTSVAGVAARASLIAVVGVGLGFGFLEAAARCERTRLAPLADPRLQLYFGWGSHTAPLDALARVLHSKNEVHVPPPAASGDRGPDGTGGSDGAGGREGQPARILFLGGEGLFEPGEDRAQHLGVQAAAAVARELHRRVAAVVVPTLYANALQQLLLFRRFYVDYAPDVIVFGVGRFEGEPTERVPPRQVLASCTEGGGGAGTTGSVPSLLLELQARLGERNAPGSTPADLRQTLDELLALRRERGFGLVLATEAGLAPALAGVVAEWSSANAVPLVAEVIDAQGRAQVDPLVQALVAVAKR